MPNKELRFGELHHRTNHCIHHDARWDSNGFTAEQGRDFLRDHLGPQLVKDGHLNLNDLDAGLRVLHL